MKWAIRILSLLPVLFYVSLWLFNEDVRSLPTLAIIYQGLLTVALLSAWRWPQTGGRLAMAGGVVFFVILLAGAFVRDDIPLAAGLLGGWMLALPYVVLGWLFLQIGRQTERDSAARHDSVARLDSVGDNPTEQ